MRSLLAVVLWAGMLTVQVHASTIQYEIQGTFSGTVPTTSITAPGASFTLLFAIFVPTIPDQINAEDFRIMTPATYNFLSSTWGLASVEIAEWTTLAGGGIGAKGISSGADSLNFVAPGLQLFSGTTANPILLEGSFLMTGDTGTVRINGAFYGLPAGTVVTATSGIPEPMSITLTMIGFGGLLLRARMRSSSYSLMTTKRSGAF